MDLFKMSNVCWKYLQMFVETRKSDPKVRGIFETCQTYMIELQKTVKTILIPLKPTQNRRSCDVFRDIKKCFLQLFGSPSYIFERVLHTLLTRQKMKDFFGKCVIKSAENCGYGRIYWKNPLWKTSDFVECL